MGSKGYVLGTAMVLLTSCGPIDRSDGSSRLDLLLEHIGGNPIVDGRHAGIEVAGQENGCHALPAPKIEDGITPLDLHGPCHLNCQVQPPRRHLVPVAIYLIP